MGQSKRRQAARKERFDKRFRRAMDEFGHDFAGTPIPCRYEDKRGTCVLDQHTGDHIFHECSADLESARINGLSHVFGVCGKPAAFPYKSGAELQWFCGQHLPGLRVRQP